MIVRCFCCNLLLLSVPIIPLWCTEQASKRFLLVQEAWETLRDEDLRREYDCRLDLQARNVVVSDEVGKGHIIQIVLCRRFHI